MAEFTGVVDAGILAAYDFTPLRTVVDVGGGNGALLVSLLQAHPQMRGVLFDQSHVAATARRRFEAAGLSGRCEVVAGDFFASLPEGGDAYLLKWIIHDWDDQRAVALLANCRRAIVRSSRLLLIEAVIPPGNSPTFHKFMDLNMMVMTGGRERTAAEYRSLLETAGFRLARIVPTVTEMSVIEAVPA
jgi:ubiquinone/menaquinone biosynthesis C-methylase UbiE